MQRLAVAPDKCYNALPPEKKLWGFALQLYSVKSKRNWGIGDFTDLKNFVRLCQKSGADVIGVNPLNVLSHDYPEEASPYASTSRQYLNPIYIDIEAVPEFVLLVLARIRILSGSTLMISSASVKAKVCSVWLFFKHCMSSKPKPFGVDGGHGRKNTVRRQPSEPENSRQKTKQELNFSNSCNLRRLVS